MMGKAFASAGIDCVILEQHLASLGRYIALFLVQRVPLRRIGRKNNSPWHKRAIMPSTLNLLILFFIYSAISSIFIFCFSCRRTSFVWCCCSNIGINTNVFVWNLKVVCRVVRIVVFRLFVQCRTYVARRVIKKKSLT